MEELQTELYKGHRIRILTDDDPLNPRTECDGQAGTMVCSHRRYDLGDAHDVKFDDHESWDEAEAWIIKEHKAIVILPIYMYDHSGITIRTTPFSCPWDSGRLGLIYTTTNMAKDVLGVPRNKKLTIENLKKVRKLLEAEVVEYDKYIRGEAYRFEVYHEADEEHDNLIDACSGYDDIDAATTDAKHFVDAHVKQAKVGTCL